MPIEEHVYDPDATDLQIRDWQMVGTPAHDLAALAKPETLQVIIQQNLYNLAQLKEHKNRVARLTEENLDLRQDREDLRVRAARTEEQSNLQWFEIPASLLSGFSINMLTANGKDMVGWVLLIVSLVLIAGVRAQQIAATVSKHLSPSGKDGKHG